MNQRWYDLETEQLEDGTIRLTQPAANTSVPHVIDLHPEQVRHIARQACGMPSATAEKIADLERRISVLTNKLQDIVCDEVMRSELIKRCGYGLQYLAQFDGLLDLALEFDGGRLEAEV